MAAMTKIVRRRPESSIITTPAINRDITISKIIILSTPTADGTGVGVVEAAINTEGEGEVAVALDMAVGDTEAAVVTGAVGGAAGAEGEAADGTTTTARIKPEAKSKRRNSDFEGRQVICLHHCPSSCRSLIFLGLNKI